MIFVFLCLTSFSEIISRSIHVAANGIISFFFYSSVIFHYIHSSVSKCLGSFHVLAIVGIVLL